MQYNNNQLAFFALLKAGLWEQDVRLLPFGTIDFVKIYKLAEEQSVVGLITSGIEHICDINAPKEITLQFVGTTLLLEQRNRTMNNYISNLIYQLNKEDINAILVKGQGIAQCYQRPLWRASGDIDLLFNADNYEKAKSFFIPQAESIGVEDVLSKHLPISTHGFEVELHGKMPFVLSKRVDSIIDDVIDETTRRERIRFWKLNDSDVALPSVDNDIIFVFTHFLHHFFIEGVGLRQICDWCRLLWTYRIEINVELLEQRLHKMGLMTEWKVFASLAVDTLGMPSNAMPFYDSRFIMKGKRALNRIMRSGNMGHNKDLSYHVRYKGLSYIIVAFWRRLCDFISFVPIFPIDSLKFFATYVFNKAK